MEVEALDHLCAGLSGHQARPDGAQQLYRTVLPRRTHQLCHRPCGDCRKERYKAFKAAWARIFPDREQSADGIDKVLHAARLNSGNSQRTWQAPLAELPDGAMIEHEGLAVLLWRGRQWCWSFSGYSHLAQPIPAGTVTVLTPAPIVALLRNGLAAELQVHASAEA